MVARVNRTRAFDVRPSAANPDVTLGNSGLFIGIGTSCGNIGRSLAASLFDNSAKLPSLIFMLSFATIVQRGLCHAGDLIAGV